MPFDSEERSPCRGCKLEKANKLGDELGDNSVREECRYRRCGKIRAYQESKQGTGKLVAKGGDNPCNAPIPHSLNVSLPLSEQNIIPDVGYRR